MNIADFFFTAIYISTKPHQQLFYLCSLWYSWININLYKIKQTILCSEWEIGKSSFPFSLVLATKEAKLYSLQFLFDSLPFLLSHLFLRTLTQSSTVTILDFHHRLQLYIFHHSLHIPAWIWESDTVNQVPNLPSFLHVSPQPPPLLPASAHQSPGFPTSTLFLK